MWMKPVWPPWPVGFRPCRKGRRADDDHDVVAQYASSGDDVRRVEQPGRTSETAYHRAHEPRTLPPPPPHRVERPRPTGGVQSPCTSGNRSSSRSRSRRFWPSSCGRPRAGCTASSKFPWFLCLSDRRILGLIVVNVGRLCRLRIRGAVPIMQELPNPRDPEELKRDLQEGARDSFWIRSPPGSVDTRPAPADPDNSNVYNYTRQLLDGPLRDRPTHQPVQDCRRLVHAERHHLVHLAVFLLLGIGQFLGA